MRERVRDMESVAMSVSALRVSFVVCKFFS